MKRIWRLWVIVVIGCLLVGTLAYAAAEAAKPRVTDSQAKEAAKALAKITGIAISPLLGVSVVGAYDWVTCPSDKRAQLPWYADWKFWLPALLLVGAVALKDMAGAALPPGWKKPLDVAETVESKVTGLVVAGAVVPSLAAIFHSTLTSAVEPSMMHASILGISLAPLLNILTIPLAVTCFVLVWLVGHVTNVLILISPWGAVDAALKSIRTGVIGLLTGLTLIDPMAAALVSAVLVIVAYFVAGWSFRLMWFGTIYTWDFFTFRRKRFQAAPNGNWMFTARQIEKTPIRTYGRLVKSATGELTFEYKPWMMFAPRTLAVPAAKLAVGRGLFYPEIMTLEPEEKTQSLFLLPPRYKNHEETLAGIYGIPEVRDVGLLKGLKAIWNWITGKSVVQPRILPA